MHKAEIVAFGTGGHREALVALLTDVRPGAAERKQPKNLGLDGPVRDDYVEVVPVLAGFRFVSRLQPDAEPARLVRPQVDGTILPAVKAAAGRGRAEHGHAFHVPPIKGPLRKPGNHGL